MTEKIYMIINEQGSHEYTILTEKDGYKKKYTLCRSNNPEWTEPGQKLISFVDDGNKIAFEYGINKRMDYCQMDELRIIMSFYAKDEDNTMPSYKLVPIEEAKQL